MYRKEERVSDRGEVNLSIFKTLEDGTEIGIPADENNSDYQAYLAWLENPEAALSTPILPE
jgi:hypothetical protein